MNFSLSLFFVDEDLLYILRMAEEQVCPINQIELHNIAYMIGSRCIGNIHNGVVTGAAKDFYVLVLWDKVLVVTIVQMAHGKKYLTADALVDIYRLMTEGIYAKFSYWIGWLIPHFDNLGFQGKYIIIHPVQRIATIPTPRRCASTCSTV